MKYGDGTLRGVFYYAGALIAALAIDGCATLGGGQSSAVLRAKNEVAPALVHIRPVKEVFTSGQREEVLIVGSGFIISPDGYVVTNEHVAGESRFVKCVLGDKNEVAAEVVGVDPYTDIALLKLDVGRPLPYVRLGDSDRIEAGELVMALGSPHGLARSVSLGIISVTDRYLEESQMGAEPYHNWIQTDAAINPGNSGGPLVNLRGEVIGVNAKVLRGAENVGFAIPINVARDVITQFKAHKRVRRAWLGLALQEMLATTDDPTQRGVVIADVDPLGPAEEAGVRPGDVLAAINDKPVHARFAEDLPALRQMMATLPIGESAHLTLQRGSETVAVTVVAEERSALKGEQVEFGEWGFTATDLTPAIARRAGLDARQGVLVSGTQPGSIARNAGLNNGDIILEMDNEPVTDLAGFREGYRARVEARRPLTLLFVKRGALTRFVLVEQDRELLPATPLEAITETE
ncbi:MAG TPA: trypsin-like peptidase domain-containing protein [Candidatus Hydrogenedentes bacterium]|nr:trypsin-like peptidase domain-containing protein [Candidatus Hydrogenedentota bacterium]